MKISKKFNYFVYFIFLFINVLKKLLHFLPFKFMIILLVTCLIIKIYFGGLVNDRFPNLKSNIFIIAGFICSNKYVKQIVFINHS